MNGTMNGTMNLDGTMNLAGSIKFNGGRIGKTRLGVQTVDVIAFCTVPAERVREWRTDILNEIWDYFARPKNHEWRCYCALRILPQVFSPDPDSEKKHHISADTVYLSSDSDSNYPIITRAVDIPVWGWKSDVRPA